jgi:DNA repair exonuclease SbcCD ATPase subunit
MNTTPRRDQAPMPKVTNLPGAPAPQARPNRSTEQVYAEEALRAAQRHIDQVAEIERLGQELEEWRRRAMMAEGEIKRLEKRESDLQDTLERRETQLIDERDSYRMRLNNMISQFHTAGAIILKCLDAAQGQSGPNISLTNLASEIERDTTKDNPDFREVEEPMPRAVTAGPREGSS